MELDFAHLKARHRAEREGFPQSLALRTHRALSWLRRAEQEPEDEDARFIFLWIAFNAAYACEVRDRHSFSERRQLLRFLKHLVDGDRKQHIYTLVWREFPRSIRLLLDNPYVFGPFWEYHAGDRREADWKSAFAQGKASAHRALGRMDTLRVLAIVLERLYVLRNQLVHGGATWMSQVNRPQVRDGVAILGLMVPVTIHLMMDNPGVAWGEPRYPVVD